jgi:hypothetical protein
MKAHYIAGMLFALAMQVLLIPRLGFADNLKLTDGTSVQGTVKKIEKGQVSVQIGSETKVFDVLDIAGIDFDAPELTVGTSRLPVEHFLADIEAQEMVGHFQEVEKSAADVRKIIDQTKQEWADRKSVGASQTAQWERAKENLYAPLSQYQEALNDLYFHVLGKVDEYNKLMKQADAVYVGVKGWFAVGSSLVPSGMERLPLKKYVPGSWYDTIFFEGYDSGYSDAAEKYQKVPY